jgi:nitronate monooxygenase
VVLRTRVTEQLGIEHPVVLAPMGFWSERSLAAAVSNAGGLGTFGAAGRTMGLTEQYVRETIAELRDRTDKPFGAGFITQLIAENPANLDIVLEEGVPVVLFSFADPTPYLALARQTPVTTVCQVQSFAAARVAVDAGADVLAVQGNEAGGHTGEQHLLPFLVRVLDAFPDVPVLAAGGITNGRGLAAVLAAGADGAWMGTAFLAAEEAAAVEPVLREAILASDGTDTIFSRTYDLVVSAGFGVAPFPDDVAFRTRRFRLAEEWDGREDQLLEHIDEVAPAFRAGVRSGDLDYSPLPYGTGAGAISGVRPAREIIEDITADAAQRLARD